MSSHLLRVSIRLTVSVGLLFYLTWVFEAETILSRVRGMRAGWVVAALAVSVVQVIVSAWRWRYTARILGVPLPLPQAIREYYLSTFITQVMPGGVTGDVARAWRHAHRKRDTPASVGPAIRAVVIERASGQIVMTLVAIASLFTIGIARGSSPMGLVMALGVMTGSVSMAIRWVRRHPSARTSVWGGLWNESREALFSRTAFPRQVISSVVVVTSYVVVYLLAARAVGVDTPVVRLLPLVAPVLVTILVPVTVAGWGAREAGAAVVWQIVGLNSEDGIVISVSYGVLVLLSSLPGGLIVAGDLLRGQR